VEVQEAAEAAGKGARREEKKLKKKGEGKRNRKRGNTKET
jgi:hypothetical protein